MKTFNIFIELNAIKQVQVRNTMISSQLEILRQAKDYLNTISITQYNEIISPNFMSSAGAHIRHIIDHYQAIMIGSHQNFINYDVRNRDSKIEHSPIAALSKITEISQWLQNISNEKLSATMTLSTEVSVSSCHVATVKTTLARELVFAASHAVHHFAMIAQIALLQHQSLPQHFGLAPATATYLRHQSNANPL